MTLIDCLAEYKRELLKIPQGRKEREFMESCFTRWYINVPKEGDDGIFPAKSILTPEAIIDLKYANEHKGTRFNVQEVARVGAALFNKYNIRCSKLIDDSIYEPIQGVLTGDQLNRLKTLYRGPNGQFELYKNKLAHLYRFIGTTTLHLSMPPIFAGVEMFGSPVNTHNREYCSPFQFEKVFGSLGSFWDYNFHKSGLYLCNPPFDEDLIKKMAERLDDMLAAAAVNKYAITVVITIPVWDSKTQAKYGLKDYGMPFAGYDKLMGSKYLMEHEVLNKDRYKYWNYYTRQKAPASWTHLITLSNMPSNVYHRRFIMSKFMRHWREWASG